ncbi:hypothetical protein LTR95_013053 [Oleoguttula sp. CCFEE 5521]
MEAVGAAASILQLINVALRSASALVEYTRNTQNASTDRKLLAEEAGNLTRVLERLKQHAEDGTVDEAWLSERKELFRQFARALDDLADTLHVDLKTGMFRKESRFNTFKTLARWSFSKSEVYALLERVTRLQQYANALLLHEQHSLVLQIDRRQQEAAQHVRRQDVLDWLTPLRMHDVHQTIALRAGHGSGKWCLTSEEFVAWRTQHSSRLWCPGIPGAGKTVMASIICESLRNITAEGLIKGEVGIAVAYLKYNDSSQTLENILGSLLRQLQEGHQMMEQALLDLHKKHTFSKTTPYPDELSCVLARISESFQDVFIIVDALDECSDDVRWGILDGLRNLAPQVHLLLTSRPIDSIEEELEDFVHLPIKANRADLELFIDQHIEKNRHLKRICARSPALRADMKDAVISTAKDMFLLARLHVESLAGAAALSISHVRKKLQSLPTTLQATYEDAMRRIEAQEEDHRAIALKALAWLSYACRPLTVGELQHALVIEPGQMELDQEMVMDGPSITALCAGLVVLDQASNAVTFVHYTASKFFTDIRERRFPGFHATITMSCATYLALKELSAASVWTLVRQYPLACYAAQFMGDHARETPEEALEQSVLHNICRLLANPGKRKALLSLLDALDLIKSGFYNAEADDSMVGGTDETIDDSASQAATAQSIPATAFTLAAKIESGLTLEETDDDLSLKDRESWTEEAKLRKLPEVTALHLAASMGLAKVASILLNDVPDIDAVDESGRTALAVAIERGFEKAVELLVNSGASVQLESEHGIEVLLLVTESDWHGVAQVIAANAGYDNDKPVSHGPSPQVQFLLAAYFGNASKLQGLMRDVGDDSEGFDKWPVRVASTALFLAVERSRVDIATLLLEYGIDVNARDSTGQTALHRAVRRGNLEFTRFLLQNDASVDAKNDSGRTPWSAYLRTTHYACLDLLLQASADPNVRGQQGVSELYEAAENGELDVVRYMLQSGTDPSIKTQFLWAPLHWAAYYGHTECVKALLSHGAERSPVSDQDATPLDLALKANQLAIVDLLIRSGCLESRDVTTADDPVVSGSDSDAEGWSSKDEKLSLAFDKPLQQGMAVGQYAYPSTLRDPKDHIYQISDPLDSTTTSISVRRSLTRADMVEYPLPADHFDLDDSLYDICRLSVDYQTLDILPRQQAAWTGAIRMKRDWTGSWKIHREIETKSEYLFRTSPDWTKTKEQGCRWSIEDGTLLARTGTEGVTPWLTFELGLDRTMEDILVTCWAAKLWSESVALPVRSRGPSVDTEQSWVKV